MAKKKRMPAGTKLKPGPKFKFRLNDSIGAADAANDTDNLQQCFVDIGIVEQLKNKSNKGRILLGRTGAGKTALLRILAEDCEHVIPIDPESLALNHISNSNILQFFTNIGMNLEVFYKLLWRHVIAIELFQKHFDLHDEESKATAIGTLINAARSRTTIFRDSREQKKRKRALEYLDKWGGRFWEDTEVRIKEVTTNMENSLKSTLGGDMSLLQANLEALRRISSEQKADIINRAQKVVNEVQVRELGTIIELVGELLSDPQKRYYVIIDKLDENWVDDKIRYKLIMGLIETCKDFSELENVKILIALRKDLLDRVFRLTDPSGRQREKYEFLEIPIRWPETSLIETIDKRLFRLAKERGYKGVYYNHTDFLPKRYEGQSISNFIVERAQRPRDIIRLINACLPFAVDDSRINPAQFKDALGDYSRSRLTALYDEWRLDLPQLETFVDLIKGHPCSFKISKFERSAIADFCLQFAVDNPDAKGLLGTPALQVANDELDYESFVKILALTFYKIGLAGLKLAPHESATWVDVDGRSVSSAELTLNSSLEVHPTYHRALGIRPNIRH